LRIPKRRTVGYENNDKKMDSVYSKRIKAGKRRTYFFDVRATRGKDYFLTITESRKRFNEESFERHKIFLYKEDFNKFVKGLSEVVDYVKTELMPDYDFDAFNHEYPEGEYEQEVARPSENGHANGRIFEAVEPIAIISDGPSAEVSQNGNTEEVDKW
jgi:hypothetical protein